MPVEKRKKGPDSAKKNEEKDAKKKDDKKEAEVAKPPSFMERHVLKVQMGLMVLAFLFSVVPRLLQGHDRFRFEDSYKDPIAWTTHFAKNYTTLARDWGVTLPINVSARLHQQVGQASVEQAKVLDVGAGSGLVGMELHRLGFRHVTGIDIVPEILEEAEHTGAYEHLYTADAEALPMKFENASFDAVLCVSTAGYLGRGESGEGGPVLDHAREAKGPPAEASRVDKLLKEWLRVLKPGGVLGITVEELLKLTWEEAFSEFQTAGLLTALSTDTGLFMPFNGDKWCAEQKVHMYFLAKA